MTTAITARRIQNAANRRNADAAKRANVILAAAFTAKFCVTVDEQVIDSAGRVVRQTPATKEEIAHFLRGNRVVDTFDILEQVGETAFNTLVANGTLVRDAKFSRFRKNNLYWISTRAIDLYDLPAKITLAGGATVAYVAA